MSALVSLHDATFRLGDRLVFHGTNWRFGTNENWAVIGSNGSGKSLFGDAIRGHLPLVGGALTYHFRPPRGFTADDCIGHVSFQERRATARTEIVQSRWNSSDQSHGLKTRDYLAYDRVLDINPFEVTDRYRTARGGFERRQAKAIRLLKIESFLDRNLSSLSNGERQRVEVARALSKPLKLLILDEPFIGLDASTRGWFCHVLNRLMKTAPRLLLLTTRHEDLPSSITRVLSVDGCRIKRAGDRPMVFPRRNSSCGMPEPPVAVAPLPADAKARESQELLRMQNVGVSYGRSVLLSGINWSVRQGESWALLGPNGSGKTTLLSLISGDNPQAYSNDIVVLGIRRGSGGSIWRLKQHIGWVSPELHAHFDDSLSCLEVVESGFDETVGVFHGISKRQKRAAISWLRRFGLGQAVLQPLFALSTGLQRLVLLARALVKEPKLLVLDEPCQGLDEKHRKQFLKITDQLIRRGKETIIYVSHRPDEIPTSIRRVLRLDKGRIVSDSA
jgi:molybdate transport system ATP-binding protein